MSRESQWSTERIVALKPGETVSIRGYELTFDGIVAAHGPNYRETGRALHGARATASVIGVMEPSKRTFPARSMSTTEAALLTRGV